MNPLTTIGLVVLAAILAFGGVQSCRLQTLQAEYDTHLASDAKLLAAAEAAARETERDLHTDTITALNQLLTDQANANLRLTALLAGRGDGTVVVRDDRKCPAPRVPPAAGDTRGDPGAPGVYLPPDAETRVLRLADHADGTADKLRACQATLTSWHRHINGVN